MQRLYETERLILKVLDKSYAETVMDYYKRNKAFLEEWEPVRSEEFYTKEYHEKDLDRELTNIENGSCLRFWIFKNNDPEKAIGSFAFNNIV